MITLSVSTKTLNSHIGFNILPDGTKDITIDLYITGANLVMEFFPAKNEHKNFVMFNKDFDGINRGRQLIKYLKKHINVEVNGLESVSEYVTEIEEELRFAKALLKGMRQEVGKKE